MKAYVHLRQYLVEFLLLPEMFQTCTETQNKHLCPINFPTPENRTAYKIIWEKCDKAGQDTDDNTVIPRLTSDTANEFFG